MFSQCCRHYALVTVPKYIFGQTPPGKLRAYTPGIRSSGVCLCVSNILALTFRTHVSCSRHVFFFLFERTNKLWPVLNTKESNKPKLLSISASLHWTLRCARVAELNVISSYRSLSLSSLRFRPLRKR